jgi:tetratricopeptide (TPR) repeat protein
MMRTSVVLLSLCLTACSAASAAPATPEADPGAAAQALFERGVQLEREGDSVRAEQYLAGALREGYDWEQALPPLLRVCLTGSRLRAGLNYATPYLKAHPEAVWLRYLISTVYLGLGQPVKAREHLLAIEGKAPYQARTQYLLGQTEWEGFGNEAAAAVHYREYLRLEPRGLNFREVSEWLSQHSGASAPSDAAQARAAVRDGAAPQDAAPPDGAARGEGAALGGAAEAPPPARPVRVPAGEAFPAAAAPEATP